MNFGNRLLLVISFCLLAAGCNPSGMITARRTDTATLTPTLTVPPSTATPTPTHTPTANATPAELSLEAAVADVVSALSGDSSRNVLVLVHPDLYHGLADELAVLETDLLSENWHPVISPFPTDSAQEMRQALQTIYSRRTFGGIFLIGDFPYVRLWGYEIQDGNQPGPSDFFYMDLDGEWLDTNGDSFYDIHSNGQGSRGPEVFVGRMDGSGVTLLGQSELEMAKTYLHRDHAYRTGNLPTVNAAVYAAPADHYYGWVDPASAGWAQHEIQSLQGLFGDTYAFIYDPTKESSDEWTSEFWRVGSAEEKTDAPAKGRFFEIMGRGYDYLSIGIHSWEKAWGGDFFTNRDAAEVSENGGQIPVFIFSGACSAAKFSSANSVGGTLTMSGALVLLGFSASSEMTWEEFVLWNNSLAKYAAGPAIQILQKAATPSGSGPVTRNVNWVLLGDPTLMLRAVDTEH
jgi:hypothetical protein